jgi:hypothetical protein
MNAARSFNGMLLLGTSILLWNCLTGIALAQYSDNLNDIVAKGVVAGVEPGQQKPTPIGNLGHLDTVLDLRGFVPMSFFSATAAADANKAGFRLDNFFPDLLRWYKVPTKKALLMLYFGEITSAQLADDTSSLEKRTFSQTRFLGESDVQGEFALWNKVAFNIAKESDALYQRIVGGSGFEAGEPTTIFFTNSSAFVILSLKFNSVIRRNSTGQVLIAMEFSRSSKAYRTFYKLYSNELMSKTTSEAFKKTAPVVANALTGAGIF